MDLVEFKKWEDDMEKNPEKRDEYRRIKKEWANLFFNHLMEYFKMNPYSFQFKHITIDLFLQYYQKDIKSRGKISYNSDEQLKNLWNSENIYIEDYEKYNKIIKLNKYFIYWNKYVSYDIFKKYFLSQKDLESLFDYTPDLTRFTWEEVCDFRESVLHRIIEKKGKMDMSYETDISNSIEFFIFHEKFTAELFMKHFHELSDNEKKKYIKENKNIFDIPEEFMKIKNEEYQLTKGYIIDDSDPNQNLEIYNIYMNRKHMEIKDFFKKDDEMMISMVSDIHPYIEQLRILYKTNPETERDLIFRFFKENPSITIDDLKWYFEKYNHCKNDIALIVDDKDFIVDRMNYFRKNAPHLFE